MKIAPVAFNLVKTNRAPSFGELKFKTDTGGEAEADHFKEKFVNFLDKADQLTIKRAEEFAANNKDYDVVIIRKDYGGYDGHTINMQIESNGKDSFYGMFVGWQTPEGEIFTQGAAENKNTFIGNLGKRIFIADRLTNEKQTSGE